MSKFLFTWSERRQALIEGDDLEEAKTRYEAGDFDSEYMHEHDLEVLEVVEHEEPYTQICRDCENEVEENGWRFWKYEPNTPLCDDCFDQRINQE